MSEEVRTCLEEISIRNLGVIENAVVGFTKGLNVLTGETGAGKTMVLTALALILGGKSDQDLVRKGSERLTVAGSFQLTEEKQPEILDLLTIHEPEMENNQLIFSRSVSSDGKSRANLGGAAVPASILTSFGDTLIEIHGQSTNLRLTKTIRQRELLDRYTGMSLESEMLQYRKFY
ncbi:MAG: AAA family ATPase, partial [Actinobacteria bacterium]|nr:AAA family ATPase [Actinomycetota bacterium]